MDRLDETIGLMGELIAQPTISSDGNLELIGAISDRLGRLGARTRISTDRSGTKANLFATLGPEGDGGVVLSGHTDVVPVADQDWTSDPFRMEERDGLLYGRGSCDMKGFIAAVLATAPAFAAAELTRPLHFAFTYDEEVGCLGALALAEELRREGLRPAVAILGEPTSMRIIEGHKGCCEYTTEFSGLAGHGSAPHKGVNAAEYAVRYATRLMELADALRGRVPAGSRFDPPWSTLQIGRIAGGIAHNVIAGTAAVDWELRPVKPADLAFVTAEIDAYAEEVLLPAMRAIHADAGIARRVIGEIAGLDPVDDNEAVAIASELTGANRAELVAFGTEAGIFQELGMSCVVCGPGSIEQAHKADEFVSREQLGACLDMLDGLAQRLTA